MIRQSYTDAAFVDAVMTSTNISEVLRKLNLVPRGGNYLTVKRKIGIFGLPTNHLLGRASMRGRQGRCFNKIPLTEILIENSSYTSTDTLRKRLLKEEVFQHKCYDCGNTEWKRQPIPLELEHKNGKRTDNRIENLTLLCPNCHALTPTYRGKNKTPGRQIGKAVRSRA